MRREIETEPEIDTLGHQWDKEDGALTTAIAEPSLVIRSIEDLKPMSAFGGSEVVMVVDGMLAEGRIALVTGEPGDGKTTLVSDIIYRVSRGALFAGRPTSQRPVLVLDKENPRTSLLAMYERLGISEHEEYRVWGDWQPDEPPAPDSPVILDWISRCHRKPLILVDSLIAFGGGDENNAAETRASMNQLRRLASMGATIIGIAHVGKSKTSKEYRGSSDFKAAVDLGVCVTNHSKTPGRLDRLAVTAFKDRLGIFTEATFRFSLGGFTEESGAIRTNVDRLIALLVQNPGVQKCTFLDLAKTEGLGRNRADSFLESFTGSEGGIRIEPGPKNSKLYSWVPKERK